MLDQEKIEEESSSQVDQIYDRLSKEEIVDIITETMDELEENQIGMRLDTKDKPSIQLLQSLLWMKN